MSNINYERLATAEDWIDAARKVVADARKAIKGGKSPAMESANAALTTFITSRTPACPQAVVEAVFGIQGELSRAIVMGVVADIAERTIQIDAFLQDIDRVAESLEESAGDIGLDGLTTAIDNVTALARQARKIRKQVEQGEMDGLADDVTSLIEQITTLKEQIKELAQPG